MQVNTTIKKTVFIRLYHDLRYKRSNNLYPIKLSVYANKTKKLYQTKFEFTPKEYEQIQNSKRPSERITNIRNQLQAIVIHAQNIADELNPFTFEEFEKRLFKQTGASETVLFYYDEKINELIQNRQIGNADVFKTAKKSLVEFVRYKKKNPDKLKFEDITPAFLTEYENWMVSNGKALTTVGIYLRSLRTLFNEAISKGIVSKDIYPFGRYKYTIPAPRKVKKALNNKELKQLFEATPQTPEQEKAKDFWFFSYVCNGMNIKDIALLRYENLNGTELYFYREKTKTTTKSDLKPITVVLNDFALNIIKKYGKPDPKPTDLIFSILDGNETPVQAHFKVKNFTRFVNQHIKKLAKSLGLNPEISTYWARHSFATKAIREGLNIELVSEALGHNDIKTTENYFAGFTDDAKKELSNRLLNFD